MAIATVVRNAGATQNDDTYTVSFSSVGHSVLLRWATETGRNRANQLEDVIQGFMRNKRNDYRGVDGPAFSDKYNALTPEQKATVDAILATAVIVPE